VLHHQLHAHPGLPVIDPDGAVIAMAPPWAPATPGTPPWYDWHLAREQGFTPFPEGTPSGGAVVDFRMIEEMRQQKLALERSLIYGDTPHDAVSVHEARARRIEACDLRDDEEATARRLAESVGI
jgi:hypothetical protein